MKLIKTALKSGMLATTLFISALYPQLDAGIFVAVIVCLGVTSFTSFFMILFTVIPFEMYHKNCPTETIFSLYFHKYAFGSLLFYFLLVFATYRNIELYLLAGIPYFTGLQAWVWYFKPTTQLQPRIIINDKEGGIERIQ